jgi:hypothetical protein
MGRMRRALVLVLPLSASLAHGLGAQGVTTGAIHGTVTGADSAAIADAIITVTNSANGERWRTVTRAGGRYVVEYLSLGGPYTIEVQAIGFRPADRSGILLSLGERRQIDFTLAPAALDLPELTVTAPGDARLNAGRSGPAQTITNALISNLPVPNRDFSQLILLSPQAILSRDGGISIAGQSDRLNGFQIDGATNSDLGGVSGLSGFGTPGSANGVRTLSVEAVRELQIAVAPFDVRYGGFAGGLVNAVTRSGSNRWEGSVSSYYQSQALTGKDSAGNRAEDFSRKELTLTIGGPIVKNRAAFFLDAGLERFVGARGLSIGADTAGGADSVGFGIRRATALRFQDILRDTYHVDPGSIEPPAPANPAGNVFAKVTLWPALNQRLEFSHNFARGILRSPGGSVDDAYSLSSLALEKPATVNASRLTWVVASEGRLSNELTAARLGERERCVPAVAYPEIDVVVSPDPDRRELSAGTVNSCSGRYANQTIWELTDNASWFAGAHHLTLGTHDELIHLEGSRRVRVPAGRWAFSSLDSLEAGLANDYLRDIAPPGRPDGPVSDFGVRQVGLYLQDQWSPVPPLTLTLGVRFDVPFLPTAPAQNPALLAALGVNTAVTPSGNLLWSPRLGFSYDVGGRGRAFVRGGVGLFSGRPIYLYFSNIYETTGLDWLRIHCRGTDVPAFTADPALQPTSCNSTSPTVFEVNYFNPAFRFPRNLRVSLGADVRLFWSIVGTVDFLYIRGVNQFDITDVNLVPTGVAAGEGGRVLYGSVDPATGIATPNRRDAGFGTVAEMRNSSGDRSVSLTGQLAKRFGAGAEVSVAYTYTDARDRMSADCFNITCNLDLTPLDGTLDNRRLATSSFQIAHKITLGAAVGLPFRFRLGVFYNGYSGRPYSYVVAGDPNADGLGQFDGNDIMYVPKNAADITLADPTQWAGLDSLIRSQPCLSSQRGQIMRRNSCRDHWAHLFNARLSRPISLGRGQSVELIADLFNVLNLFDRDWGVRRSVGTFDGNAEALLLVGYDEANQRGIYDVLPVDTNVRDVEGTRWRLQLGVRYGF